jgi:hypothetical protein
MKVLRNIIFIPIIYSIIWFVLWLIPFSLKEIMGLNKFSLIFFMIVFGGILVYIYFALPAGVTWLISKISPRKNFAFFTILIISIFLGVLNIVSFWAVPGLIENGILILLSVILTSLTIGITLSLCIGAVVAKNETEVPFIAVLTGIGMIVFLLGIFLTFCLLTINICYIEPYKTYTWYSGIWHGLFVIPHWVVSWFSEGIYCKAPNSTTAYSIWWWITLIFFHMGIIGGLSSKN